jgi:GNAT superfamily N-acetyltransferase
VIRIQSVTGPELEGHFDELARLRVLVFREFPYLYEGDAEYERNYLATYAKAEGSVVVLAFDGERVVGASTGVPLRGEPEYVRGTFTRGGYDPERVYYFGESVLERSYRGQGIGVRFFEEREAQARRLGGFEWASFCAVERPREHPRRPPDYVPLDEFWGRRGFVKHPELHTEFSWQDLDEASESPKPMVFWLKKL